MAIYNGQRGPNVSEFMATLNAIPPAQDVASQNQDNFNLDEELAMFTNTQFFDFDLGQDADLQSANFDFNAQPGVTPTAATNDTKSIDFIQGRFSTFVFSNLYYESMLSCIFDLHCFSSCRQTTQFSYSSTAVPSHFIVHLSYLHIPGLQSGASHTYIQLMLE